MKTKLMALFFIAFFILGFYAINVKIAANMNNKAVRHPTAANQPKKSNLKFLDPNFFHK
jgi:hypothetical protein